MILCFTNGDKTSAFVPPRKKIPHGMPSVNDVQEFFENDVTARLAESFHQSAGQEKDFA